MSALPTASSSVFVARALLPEKRLTAWVVQDVSAALHELSSVLRDQKIRFEVAPVEALVAGLPQRWWRGTTILYSEGAQSSTWRAVDRVRSRIVGGPLILVLSEQAADAMSQYAPHLQSLLGGKLWSRQDSPVAAAAEHDFLWSPDIREEADMAVVLSGVPPTMDWGWYSNEDERMHIQTVDREHRNQFKVWLEARGRRIFEPATEIPARVLRVLEPAVRARRRMLEDHWVGTMIQKGWIRLDLHGRSLRVTAYPGGNNSYVRTVNLDDHIAPDIAVSIADFRLVENPASIAVWPNRPRETQMHLPLADIIFVD